MAIRKEHKGALRLVGCGWTGSDTNEIPKLWDEQFMPRVNKLVPGDGVFYGFCDMRPGLPEGAFYYLAAAEQPEGAPVPEGMEEVVVPESDYAVFDHSGPLEKLSESYERAFGEMGAEGVAQDVRHSFELYPSDFCPETNSRVELWFSLASR